MLKPKVQKTKKSIPLVVFLCYWQMPQATLLFLSWKVKTYPGAWCLKNSWSSDKLQGSRPG